VPVVSSSGWIPTKASGHTDEPVRRPAGAADKPTEFWVAKQPGKRRALPDTPEGRLQNLIETAKDHIRSKVEPPIRVKQQGRL